MTEREKGKAWWREQQEAEQLLKIQRNEARCHERKAKTSALTDEELADQIKKNGLEF
jgi:hypothetical protein